MIALEVNGLRREESEATSVAQLLHALRLDSVRVAVERNGAIVPRPEYGTTILAEGDRLEIVQFVGGG